MNNIYKNLTKNYVNGNLSKNISRSLYAGVRFDETLASWRSAQSGEAKNIQWCRGSATVRTTVILAPASRTYKKPATWIYNPEDVEYERSKICLKNV